MESNTKVGNMKSLKTTYLALMTLILASCEIVLPSVPFSSTQVPTSNDTTSTTTTSETQSSIGDSSTTSLPSSSATNSSSQVQELGYAKQTNPSITLDSYRQSSGNFGLPSTGDVKLLVIPVTFTDYRCGNLCVTRKEQIRKTFFGTANETSWHSVKSYYEASSYGNLTLTGVVTDWFDSSWSSSQFASLTTTEGDYPEAFDPTWAMLDAAVAWYKSYSGSDLTEYDTDFDGFIDSVYLVYNNPNATNAVYSTAGEDVYWAYTYWHYNNFGNQNLSSPVGMTLVWSSFDFMFEGYGPNGLDAHTYIHELGHAFGLDDYYTYSENDWGAAGGLDMMDYNILDHNAFSKYLLGWTNPYVLTTTQTTTTITLNAFASSGDFFLLGNSWNGSAFDNYLVFEYYTPTGLNEKDSQAAYPGNNVRGFTVPGVKIYHVDARLGKYANSTGAFGGYTDTLNVGFSNYTYIAHSNSIDYSQNENFKLLHLLEESGTNTFVDGELASNATLFRAGDTFNPATTHSGLFYNQGGRFNDNSLIGYSVSFSNLTSQSVTLTVTKI
jgi:M6 family metalloprotease-like protein